MFSGVALLLLGIVLAGSGIALAADYQRVGTRAGHLGAVAGALFGNRRALGREATLGRFYGLIMLVVGCGAVTAAIPRL